MLNKGVLSLLIASLALLASPGLAPPASAAQTLVVDVDNPSCTGSPPNYSTITAALAAAGNGDTIRVCAGNYTEDTLNINVSVTITGPGATPANDGVATLHHSLGGSSDMVIISADGVTFEGLDLDATPPLGWFFDTSGISGKGNYVTIQDNEIRNATSTAVGMGGIPSPTDVNILRNNVHDNNGVGIGCYCDHSGLWNNTVDGAGSTALGLEGNQGTIGGNVVTNGTVSVAGNNLVVQNNQISAGTASSTLYVSGNPVTVTGNNLSDADYYGVEVNPGMASSTSVSITHNTFTDIRVPINLNDSDPNDAFDLTATIGGSPSEANTFVGSGGSLGDQSYLVEMDGATSNVNAEYNNWGLCTLAEIEQEIYDHADDPALGTVDYDPFIAPDSCSATPTATATPTPTPTPTATLGPTATPTPGGTRAVTIPPGSWANFAWTGDSAPQTIADCFGIGNIAVMYRLDATTQTFERWIHSRPDLSNMTDVQPYDALLALNGGAQPATCNMPSQLLPRSLIIPAGSWANFAWTGNFALPAAEATVCFGEGNIAVMYRLDATTQTFERWIHSRPDLSNMTDVQPYDALLALNGGAQPATCEFPT